MRPTDLGKQLMSLDDYGLRPDQKIHAIELLLNGYETTAKAAVIRILKSETRIAGRPMTMNTELRKKA